MKNGQLSDLFVIVVHWNRFLINSAASDLFAFPVRMAYAFFVVSVDMFGDVYREA